MIEGSLHPEHEPARVELARIAQENIEDVYGIADAVLAAGYRPPIREDEQDGPCQHCDGVGCVACSARCLDWDVRLVAELSRAFPKLTAPLLAEIVAFIENWKTAAAELGETP